MKTKWIRVGKFGNHIIYALGDSRVLYNPVTKKIEHRYEISKFAKQIVNLKKDD
jgi:hypothetical protein